MTYCLETGQEPAAMLLEFFKDVDRPNVKINFDPANMVLYGSGDPHEAFRTLAGHVVSVHAKDGDWPDPAKPGSLGTERPLGRGSVDLPRFIKTIREAGYTGTLNIESGVHGEEQKWAYLKRAVEYLKGIVTAG
jgi:sugar phosphate isomerase/epimerase